MVYYFNNPLFKGALSVLRQFLATESPLKMMKNAFYFTLKAFFVLKTFKFLFLVMEKNGLIRKIKLIRKFKRHSLPTLLKIEHICRTIV